MLVKTIEYQAPCRYKSGPGSRWILYRHTFQFLLHL